MSSYLQLLSNYIQSLIKYDIIVKPIYFKDWQIGEKPNPSFELFNSPVMKTIYYSCSQHKWTDTDPTAKYNPFKLVEVHGVSQAQFEWVALNERAKSQAWKDLEGLFEKKVNPLCIYILAN